MVSRPWRRADRRSPAPPGRSPGGRRSGSRAPDRGSGASRADRSGRGGGPSSGYREARGRGAGTSRGSRAWPPDCGRRSAARSPPGSRLRPAPALPDSGAARCLRRSGCRRGRRARRQESGGCPPSGKPSSRSRPSPEAPLVRQPTRGRSRRAREAAG